MFRGYETVLSSRAPGMQGVSLQPPRDPMGADRLNVPGVANDPQTSVSSSQMAQDLFHEAIRRREEL